MLGSMKWQDLPGMPDKFRGETPPVESFPTEKELILLLEVQRLGVTETRCLIT